MKKKLEHLPAHHFVSLEDPLPVTSAFVEDPLPTAAVISYEPLLTVRAEPTYAGRVGFRIEGDADRIKAAFKALSDDRPIGARTLIDQIKRLRTEMFRVKAANVGRK